MAKGIGAAVAAAAAAMTAAVVATASYVNDCIGVYAGFDPVLLFNAFVGLFCFFYLFLLFLVCIL